MKSLSACSAVATSCCNRSQVVGRAHAGKKRHRPAGERPAAYDVTRQGQYEIDPDGAQEGAFASHVGSRNDIQVVQFPHLEIVADFAFGIEQRMAHLFGLQ